MRKALIAVCLLFALSVGGIAAVHADVNEVRDQVVITEKVLYGDKAAAEGLTIRAEARLDKYLHWNTDYTIGAQPVTETEFVFAKEERWGDYEPGGLSTASYHHWYGIDEQDWENADSPEGLSGLALAYWEFFQTLEIGEEKDELIRVGDYYDYYPFRFGLELPNFYMDFYHMDGVAAGTEQAEIMRALNARLQEYIKIPVMEDETIRISLYRSGEKQASRRGMGTGEGDFYHDGIYNALTADACYFIINNRSRDGKLMDLSQVPGGYGIHILPYTYSDDRPTTVDVEGIKMVYPLDEESELLWFETTPDKSRLLLMTKETNGDCLLRVIACDGMKTIQETVLYTVTEERQPYVERCQDNYILIRTWDGSIILLEERPDGTYERVIDIPVEEHQQVSDGFHTTYWDGEKLVLAVPWNVQHRDDGELCGFAVAVYDKTGPLFCGKYTSSLDTKSFDYYDSRNCTLWSDDPLHISWK